ncbi:MAG: ClpXP protease specificity-enhancing factor [Gammaproteobacteria bacterium]
MTSNRPYLVRALNDWINDNAMTPHILVNAEFPGVVVPSGFVEDGKVVLNISNTATQGLLLGNDQIVFSARFSGKPVKIEVPVNAVMAIYARENGMGMIFPEEATSEDGATETETGPGQSKPVLKVVK